MISHVVWASLVAQLVKDPPAVWETWVRSLGWEDSLETGKAIHSNILPWRIPWTVQSMGQQRVGHSESEQVSLSLFTQNQANVTWLERLLYDIRPRIYCTIHIGLVHHHVLYNQRLTNRVNTYFQNTTANNTANSKTMAGMTVTNFTRTATYQSQDCLSN